MVRFILIKQPYNSYDQTKTIINVGKITIIFTKIIYSSILVKKPKKLSYMSKILSIQLQNLIKKY